MAKIKIRKVIRDLDIDEYYDSGESEIIKVWVNPPRKLRDQLNDDIEESKAITAELADVSKDDKVKLKALAKRMVDTGDRIVSFWSTIWSQDQDKETHFSTDEVKELQKVCNENDPALWLFLATMSIGLMNDYLSTNQKKGKRR